jgi:CheY-like chemotaxis protein
VDEKAVYALARKGTAELNSAETSLSALELKVLVLIDGQANLGRILKTFHEHPQAEMLDLLHKLKKADLIAEGGKDSGGGEHGGIEASGFFSRPVFAAPGTAEAEAAAQSDQTLELLKRNGYVVRIAKRAAEERKLAKGEKITVLVIEDDAQLAKLVRIFLMMHELVPRMAANKDEIVAALRLAPKPDVVLLDVVLPDIDGFDVLARLKQHPILKSVPVIMMTAKASREAVLKGLARGADGYLTKPFDVDVISQAVKSVLGIR